MEEDIIIGVPFYEDEEDMVFENCKQNLLDCLDVLRKKGFDAKVVFIVNGKATSDRTYKKYKINDSRISIMYSYIPGQVCAINYFAQWAQSCKYKYIFITDSDIYRRPECIVEMLKVPMSKALVGAKHTVYPLDCVIKKVKLTEDEKYWYEIFEGDKNPKILDILQRNNFSRLDINKNRIKGSLMRINTDLATKMHGKQTKVSDSIINQMVPSQEKYIVNAYYYHMGRISLTDHIVARLRHFQGAKSENLINELYLNEKLEEDVKDLDKIANCIKDEIGIKESQFFLLRCALRELVADYCLNTVNGNSTEYAYKKDLRDKVCNYNDALSIIESQLAQLVFKEGDLIITNGIGTTQTSLPRYAINV
jgi:hypothetical protein